MAFLMNKYLLGAIGCLAVIWGIHSWYQSGLDQAKQEGVTETVDTINAQIDKTKQELDSENKTIDAAVDTANEYKLDGMLDAIPETEDSDHVIVSGVETYTLDRDRQTADEADEYPPQTPVSEESPEDGEVHGEVYCQKVIVWSSQLQEYVPALCDP